MIKVYVHDYGLIGKYAMIDESDGDGMSLNFKDIPFVIVELQKIYEEYKDYTSL